MKINSKATHVSRDGGGDIATGLRATELDVRNQVEERPFSFHQKFPWDLASNRPHIQWASNIVHGDKAAQA